MISFLLGCVIARSWPGLLGFVIQEWYIEEKEKVEKIRDFLTSSNSISDNSSL